MNGSGELDRNFPGAPLEPDGLGNGATLQFFHPPAVDAAAVVLRKGDNAIRIAVTRP